METKATYRVLIFEDDESIRTILWYYFDDRGYEVFTFPNPGNCPVYGESPCQCPLEESCSDIIISDLNMRVKRGLDFLEEQLSKGCRCKNMALMSGDDLSPEDIERASSLKIKLFQKPFTNKEIAEWVSEIEKKIDPARRLANWFLRKSGDSEQGDS
jgi:DNA-binding NtrC family response regulator